jgi:hypothetical protein
VYVAGELERGHLKNLLPEGRARGAIIVHTRTRNIIYNSHPPVGLP